MSKNGFTLIEILIVICVLAILSSFTFPAFSVFSAQLSLAASAKALASELRALQSQAILQNKNLSLDLGKIKFPCGISFLKTSNLCFSSSGYPSVGGTGTLILQNKFNQTKKIVVSSVGRVRVE